MNNSILKLQESSFGMSVKNNTGFTLIELIIVIGVLGVLAAVLLIAIDPIEQLTRAKDAGKKTAIKQLGEAVLANYALNGTYITPDGSWMESLLTSGDLKTKPKNSDDGHCTYF